MGKSDTFIDSNLPLPNVLREITERIFPLKQTPH